MVGSTGGGDHTDPRAPDVIDVASPSHVRIGHRLGGRYLLKARLAAGGMGTVWLAFDEKVGDEVALKILTQQGDFKEHLERFRREVAMARKIAHRNVCRVFDLGEAEGIHYLTMELIPGENLRQVIRRGPITVEAAMSLLRQILSGVAAAHDAGVMHRDLKPENVVVSPERAVVVDFGLARPALSETSTTAVQAGTPAYMAPEQLGAETVDLRSDVFACGVIAYEILSGKSPFTGNTPATVASSILRDEPARLELTNIDDKMRRAVEHVLHRALSKNRDDRQATAGILLAQLERAFAGEEDVGFLQTVPAQRQARPARRRWMALAVAVGFGGAAAGLGIIRAMDQDAALIPPVIVPTTPPRADETPSETKPKATPTGNVRSWGADETPLQTKRILVDARTKEMESDNALPVPLAPGRDGDDKSRKGKRAERGSRSSSAPKLPKPDEPKVETPPTPSAPAFDAAPPPEDNGVDDNGFIRELAPRKDAP